MTPADHEAIERLRARGYAVVLFSPDELEGVYPDRLEMRLEDYGCDLIGEMAPDEEWLWSPDPVSTTGGDCPEQLEHTNKGT